MSSKSSKIFYFKRVKYLLNWSHEFFFTYDVLFDFTFLWKGLSKILIIFLSDLLFDNFLDCVKVVILEYVILKILKLLITKGTTMMAIDCLLNTGPAIYMTASRDVAISNRVETDCTLELCFKLLWTNLEVDVVLLFDHHFEIFWRLKDWWFNYEGFIICITKNYWAIV